MVLAVLLLAGGVLLGAAVPAVAEGETTPAVPSVEPTEPVPDDDPGDPGDPEQLTSVSRPEAEQAWAQETELAERYAPQLMLVRQDEACGAGEPYFPSDAEVMFDNPDVALRGPWTDHDLVTVGPSAEDVAPGLRGWELDMPGDPLDPGCTYERWVGRQWGTFEDSVVYAHVATQDGVEDRLALMYWFFYPYNDYNNKHEADWERIQLEFPVGSVAEALDVEPDRAVYSQHYGSEEATWGSDKLRLDDDTHPLVYVSAGSHASQFAPGLFMGNSAFTGFGCDITIGPHDEVRPLVRTIPSDPALAGEEFAWIDYEGRWGQSGPRSFYDGPTGPAAKSQWQRPFAWSADARSSSIAVPGGAAAGTEVTDFYCGAVAKGSDAFRSFVQRPGTALLGLALLLWVVVLLARRTTWRSVAVPARQRRSSAQVVHAAWLVGRGHPRLFAALTLPTLAITLVSALVNTVALTSAPAWWAGVLVSPLLGFGLLVAVGATCLAVAGLDEGRRPEVRETYAGSARACLLAGPALVVAALLTVLAATSLFLLPLALVMLGVWSILVPVVVLERRTGLGGLVRSARLVRGSLRVLVPVVAVGLLVATSVGALVAALLFVVVPLPFVVLNLLPPVTLALLWPLLSVTSAYAYFSAVAAGGAEEAADQSEASRRVR